jgi:isopentenyl diphosphate isomerase/L-lactate dehydrogenase-like FMN-dependent dehydrogenase
LTYRELLYERIRAGDPQALPVDVVELEQAAAGAISEVASAHLFGGAGTAETTRANREAFQRIRLVPRVLRDVSAIDLSCRILGEDLPAPVLLAPIGGQELVQAGGELTSARAAAALGIPVIASTRGSFTPEQIAEAVGAGRRWFQLYCPADDEILASFVRRVERSGYSAIVLTVDCFAQGWRPLDMQLAGPLEMQMVGSQIFFSDPAFRASLARSPEEDPVAAEALYRRVRSRPALSWDDLGLLRELTSLPIVLKGIQHPDDAREALSHGVGAIVCSNHGGRQVDGAIGSLDALPAILEAVGGRGGGVPVLFDGGIRSGSDVIKALALGAEAVLIGRPFVCGLALAGAAGVDHVLRCLLGDLELTLGLCGVAKVTDLGPQVLVSAPSGTR